MIIELIQRVFCARNCAHLAHWRTKSYAQHKALGSFYDDVIDGIDSLVEAYMGTTGSVIEDFDVPATKPAKDILKYLSDEVRWINEHRDEIANEIPALENIVDDLTATYLKTIYKLKQLS